MHRPMDDISQPRVVAVVDQLLALARRSLELERKVEYGLPATALSYLVRRVVGHRRRMRGVHRWIDDVGSMAKCGEPEASK